jgi:membrane fusion protein (multidrug efflux system)
MADADPKPTTTDETLTVSDASAKPSKRKPVLTGIAAAVLLGGAAYGTWYTLVGSHYVETDNAYVGADTAQVTPMVAGQAIAVMASDTQSVKRGDILVRLDDRDARITLASAEADLAKARRQFGQTAATSGALSAQVQARGADITSARAQLVAALSALSKAQVDFDRRVYSPRTARFQATS